MHVTPCFDRYAAIYGLRFFVSGLGGGARFSRRQAWATDLGRHNRETLMTAKLMTAAVALTLALAAPVATAAEPFGPDAVRNYRQSVSGRVPICPLMVHNDFTPGANGRVTLELWHPDALARDFGHWPIDGGALVAATGWDGKPLVVGLDWGARVIFGNGVKSEVRMLRDVAAVAGGKIVVKATDIHKGVAPAAAQPQNAGPVANQTQPARGSLKASGKGNIQQTGGGTGSMSSDIVIAANGRATLTTRTWTKVKLNGFTGGVRVVVFSDDGDAFVSDEYRYGVDGTLIGRSDRMDVAQFNIPPAVAARATHAAVLIGHSPKYGDALHSILFGAKRVREMYDGLKRELGPMIVELAAVGQ